MPPRTILLAGTVAKYDDAVLTSIRRALRTIAPGDRFSIITFDPDDPIGVQPAAFGSPLGLSDLGRALMRRVLAEGTLLIVEDLPTDPELSAAAAAEGIVSAVAMPVYQRGRIVGVASVFLDDAEQLQTIAARDALERLRAGGPAAPSRQPAPPPIVEQAEAAADNSAVPRASADVATNVPSAPILESMSATGADSGSRPLIDLVAAVMGEAVGRLDAEFGRAEEMTEANRLKTEFISVISHELRSPLTYVLGFSEILAERELTMERIRHIASEMNRESKRMLQLVDDLLDISRMEAGRYTLDPQPVNIAQEIRQLLVNVATTTTQHQLVADCPDELIAMADAVRVWQVLQNLIGNAVRYSPAGGTVTVRARRAGPSVQVDVIDQGIGIPASEQPKIFEKFYRVDSELKNRVRGTGLGLAICRAIVESHGGRIWLESEQGKGSVFSFSLPVGAITEPSAAPLEVASAPE